MCVCVCVCVCTTQKILKTPLTKDSYDQACVSSRCGGFGIRRVEDHAPIAFNASWLTSRVLCKEDWKKPIEGMPDRAPKQRGGSWTRQLVLSNRRPPVKNSAFGAWIANMPTLGLLQCRPPPMERTQSSHQAFSALPLAVFSACVCMLTYPLSCPIRKTHHAVWEPCLASLQ